ncbi:MAG TPA: glycosyltransferase family 1 protein [Candidatus Magasanikbacteria bacterium]|nr:glycosyltransferase family 1 protein [Candidatus Magasanikbacteria bacterium]HQL53045.1 glycosyltransferase family 1 protein [Candidatus Magasanikbacteria bacterium]
MNIGVDIRCLMDKERTGVGEYTYNLLKAIFLLDKENQYYLFYNSNKNIFQNIPQWKKNNVHYVGTKYPNKLLNLLLWFKIVKLDKILLRHFERIYSKKKKLSYLSADKQNLKEVKDFIQLKINLPVAETPLHFVSAQNDELIWFSPNLNFTNLSKKIKHLQTIHDLSFEFLPECFTWKQRLWHWFLNPKKQCQKADIILTPSENTKQDMVNEYGIVGDKIQILQPGISWEEGLITTENIQRVKEKYNLPEKYILYLGTLEPRKNIESIIEAYNISGLKIKNYELIIVGGKGWKNKKLLKLIENSLGVKYIGYVNKEDKQLLYNLSSLFIFPSLYEGFGLPVLEAMSQEIPVITSNRTSLPEVIGTSGYLVNPYNVLELAEAMKNILSDEKLRKMLIIQSKEQTKKFNWNNSAKKFLNLICELV